jgi:hypothetical protein
MFLIQKDGEKNLIYPAVELRPLPWMNAPTLLMSPTGALGAILLIGGLHKFVN